MSLQRTHNPFSKDYIKDTNQFINPYGKLRDVKRNYPPLENKYLFIEDFEDFFFGNCGDHVSQIVYTFHICDTQKGTYHTFL